MNRRDFLKIAGTAAVTLAAREGIGAMTKVIKNKNKRVIAINGSPNANGNTNYTLSIIGEVLAKENIKFDILQMGAENIKGCIACQVCKNSGSCVFASERETAIIEEMKQSDAIIIGAPVYFGGIPGTMKSFLDKAFYANGKTFKDKLGASVVTCARAGSSVTFQNLNQYFAISQMPIVSSTYWNNVRGRSSEAIRSDEEGRRTMENLAKNLAALLKKGA